MNRFNFTSNDSPFDRSPERSLEGRASSFSSPFAGRGAQLVPGAEAQGEESEGVRWDLIRRLRREIAAGTYASPERWQRAVESLSDDLAG